MSTDLISRSKIKKEISEILADILISGFRNESISFDKLNDSIQNCIANQPNICNSDLEEYKKTGLSAEVCKNYKLFEDEVISKGKDFNHIVELLKAEDQGLIFKLPISFNNNRVYYLDIDRELHYGYIEQYVITKIGYSFLYINSDNEWDLECNEYDIGKKIFFSKEDAIKYRDKDMVI